MGLRQNETEWKFATEMKKWNRQKLIIRFSCAVFFFCYSTPPYVFLFLFQHSCVCPWPPVPRSLGPLVPSFLIARDMGRIASSVVFTPSFMPLDMAQHPPWGHLEPPHGKPLREPKRGIIPRTPTRNIWSFCFPSKSRRMAPDRWDRSLGPVARPLFLHGFLFLPGNLSLGKLKNDNRGLDLVPGRGVSWVVSSHLFCGINLRGDPLWRSPSGSCISGYWSPSRGGHHALLGTLKTVHVHCEPTPPYGLSTTFATLAHPVPSSPTLRGTINDQTFAPKNLLNPSINRSNRHRSNRHRSNRQTKHTQFGQSNPTYLLKTTK
jgi:hypothetical protein